MFDGAKVASVHTMNYAGKTKRRGMIYGKTAKKKNKRNEYKMNFYVENYSFVW